MKKLVFFLVVGVFFSFVPCSVLASEDLLSGASSGLLMEISTGDILYEKNINDELAIASMTKMMSQILILEAVESGKINWDDEVKVSRNAADFGGSQIWLQANEIMSVRDLMKGISMASANDATVALAEEIAGSEEEFVKMMNEKARELKLEHTMFSNSTGLDTENHYSSSYDLAVIARHLILEHPIILEFSSVYEDYLRTDTPNKFWLVNTNKLVRFYDGADGLKTGHTDLAKYCMAVTAKRDDMRLLAVVLGEDTASIRNQETTELLDYGFQNYELQILKRSNEVVDKISFNKADKNSIDIVLKNDLTKLLKKNEEYENYEYEVKLNDLKFPILKGDIVGKLLVKQNDEIVKEEVVTVLEDVYKLGFFKIWGRFIKSVIIGI